MNKRLLIILFIGAVLAVCGYFYLKFQAAFEIKPDFPVQIEHHKATGKALGQAQALSVERLAAQGHYPEILWRWLLSAEAAMDADKAAQVKRVRDLLQRWDPQLLAEIDGLIDALELPSADALLVLTGWGFQPDIMRGCTQLVVRHKDGGLLVGRNYDFHPNLTDRRVVILHTPNGGFHVGSSEFVVGRLEGMNQAGFYAGASFAHGIQAQTGPPEGFFFSTIVRILLDKARSVEQGLALIKELPHSSPYNYLLADAAGNAAAVEVGLNKVVVRRLAPEQRFLSAVNHYQSEQMQTEQKKRMENSTARAAYIKRAVEDAAALSDQELKSWLSAPYPKGLALPWYDDFLGTLYSFVFDLKSKQVWFSAGKPQTGGFQLVSLDENSGVALSVAGKIPVD